MSMMRPIQYPANKLDRLIHDGIIPPPTFDWDFARKRNLIANGRPPIVFTRGSSGTYFDAYGVLQTASTNVARFDHNPVTGSPLGPLIEEQRENECLQSETLTTSPWAATGTYACASNGTIKGLTRFLITKTGTTEFHQWRQNVTWTVDTQYTISEFMEKATAGDEGQIVISQNVTNNSMQVKYDLVLGTATEVNGDHATGTLDDFGIVDFGGGVFLCWITFEFTDLSASTGGSFGIKTDNRNTDGDTVFASAVQWEAGAFPTSYIATTTAAVTRSADVADRSADVADHSGLIEARTALGGGTQTLISIDDGTANERIYIERNSSDEIHLLVIDGGVEQADLNLGTVADDTDFKVAYRVSASDFAGSLDGAAVVTDTGGTMPTVTTKKYGRNHAGANYWNRTIAQDVMWAGGLNNGHLQRITS